MANAGGAWDNAKKIVETELKAKGTELHDACVVGDTVGDPFKDTSSVAMNPIIKFTTLFGLLAVELANDEANPIPRETTAVVAALCSSRSLWSSFGARLLRHAHRIEHQGRIVPRGGESQARRVLRRVRPRGARQGSTPRVRRR